MDSRSIRLHIVAQGLVQGVGFRPVVYRLATQLGLVGWVNNSTQGAVVEIEGERSRLQVFLQQLPLVLPAPAEIHHLAIKSLSPLGYHQFSIRPSSGDEAQQPKTAAILPDLATCPACLAELFNPQDRRFYYPFINCTHCGPRFSIIQSLPYDRPNTTMAAFHLCGTCKAEYTTATDRRFHAQPNACATCGPQLTWWENNNGQLLASASLSPLQQATAAIRAGKIVALKGLGGFQLIVDAQNEAAVQRLRQRKHRPDKPLAVMFPALEQAQAHCLISSSEADWLRSPQAPIVLLQRWQPNSPTLHPQEPAIHPQEEVEPQGINPPEINKQTTPLAANLAPDAPKLGVMLPYTPLHHLLLKTLNRPIVATSGNLNGDPLCISEAEAFTRLVSIADGFLVHNRPIQRPVDDSVVQGVGEQMQMLRRARGYAPLPLVSSPTSHSQGLPYTSVLAVGAHLKNAIALSLNHDIFLSQHIGDLETPKTFQQFQKTITDFETLYDCQPQAIACDLHPDYRSTHWAQQLAAQRQIPLIPVQHHYAHALACMTEHALTAPTLAVVWDGSGYGMDQTIWGGEILWITEQGFQRLGHLLPFPLPGGTAAIREPRRSGLSLLYQCFGEAAFQMQDLPIFAGLEPTKRDALQLMLSQNYHSPRTSSIGRLFDGVAALLGLHLTTTFEAQAAMALEFELGQGVPALSPPETYPFNLMSRQSIVLDWRPMIMQLVEDITVGIPKPMIARKFHNTLVQATLETLLRLYGQGYPTTLVLAGGCFQNTYLLEQLTQQLQTRGFSPYFPQMIPTSDGGISVGQIASAWRHPVTKLTPRRF